MRKFINIAFRNVISHTLPLLTSPIKGRNNMPLDSFIHICFVLLFVLGLGIGEAGATCSNPGQKCPDLFSLHQVQLKGTNSKAPDSIKSSYSELQSLQKQIEALCQKGDKQVSYAFCITERELIEGMQKAGIYQKYKDLQKKFNKVHQKIVDYRDPNNCGHMYPYGCPDGKKCYVQKSKVAITRGGMNAHEIDVDSNEPVCLSGTPDMNKYEQVHFNTTQTVLKEAEDDNDKTVETNTTSAFSTGLGTHSTIDPDGNVKIQTTYADGTLIDLDEDARTNKACDIEGQKQKYLGTCYSCTIVANLIRVFMNAAAATAPLTQEAGVKLLLIGMVLWFAFYVLRNMSSFVSAEPMRMLQEIFTFLFKCLLAYVVITSGLLNIIQLMVNPVLVAGADYGITMIDTVTDVKLDYTSVDQKTYKIGAEELINQKVFDKIMTISKKADAAMSLNFVIGDAVMCHATHAGAIVIAKKITDTFNFPPFYFPDIWIWICGAVIYFFAFLVVMGINFYLLDLSFKIGFALLALPITIGLWPFEKFKNKFAECIKIIVNAAGTFLFLGITSAMSIVLISSALGGTEQLFEAIKADNKAYIAQRFSLTGASFLLILFAFLYSHKLISKTVSSLTDKFFGSQMSGMTPIHGKTTQMIDFAKKTVGDAVSTVGGAVTGGASTAIKQAGKAVAKQAVRKVVKGAQNAGRTVGKAFRK